MGARYLTELVEVLDAAGLDVVIVDGWETRARGSGGYDGNRPWCIMWHHTASDSTPENDVSYIIHSDDAPLANLYLARNGEVWVCAAGATNTNGKGGPLTVSRGTIPADSMNTYAIGIEAANDGVGQQWPQVQVDAYFRINNALAAAYGLLPTDLSSHEHWSPGRKIDPATAAAVQGPWLPRSINSSGTWSVDDIRGEAVARTAGPTPPPQPEGDDVEVVEVKVTGANARFLGHRVKQTTRAIDGSTAERQFLLWAEWVDGNDPIQFARYQAYQNMGVPTWELPDLTGVGLIGPIPTGDALKTWTRNDFGNVL